MSCSPPSLHAPVLETSAHKKFFMDKLALITREEIKVQEAKVFTNGKFITIPLTTVSRAFNFDANINIRYRGAPSDSLVTLLVDSGNSSLIVPHFSQIEKLPNFSKDYKVLINDVNEPWGCPACIVRGSIEIPTQGGGIFEISDCTFYACTGPNDKGDCTANFGMGCITPWGTVGKLPIKAPLAYNRVYPYAQLAYAPAAQMFAIQDEPKIDRQSSLVLHKVMPEGYRMFDIIKNLFWMSLRPNFLNIASTETGWPGELTSSSIAMIDTGGGPVFLSDPKKYLYARTWPNQVSLPWWTSDSDRCQSVNDDLVIGVGDRDKLYSYRIATANLPSSVQNLTLVICKRCSYMQGNDGMNIGGLSALFNYILIDYVSARVGFRPKSLDLV
jgi:hypothetical protein